MLRLDQALQALQDQAAAAASSSSSRQEVVGLAGQLLHAGRQDRAAQVRGASKRGGCADGGLQ
jgi:hypothetical protein